MTGLSQRVGEAGGRLRASETGVKHRGLAANEPHTDNTRLTSVLTIFAASSHSLAQGTRLLQCRVLRELGRGLKEKKIKERRKEERKHSKQVRHQTHRTHPTKLCKRTSHAITTTPHHTILHNRYNTHQSNKHNKRKEKKKSRKEGRKEEGLTMVKWK